MIVALVILFINCLFLVFINEEWVKKIEYLVLDEEILLYFIIWMSFRIIMIYIVNKL